MSRLRAYLELVRLPNLFTAIADVVAGFVYMGGRWQDLNDLAPLAGASVFLYAGGVAFNDVCDARRDAVDRPERPIPSGRIHRLTAAAIAIALLLFGILLGAWASRRAGIIAILLVAAILLYDLACKSTAWSPWIFGLCRALNLSLGLSIHPTFRTFVETLPILLLIATYTASIVYFARDEATTSSRKRLVRGTVGITLSTLSLSLIPFIAPAGRLDAVPFIAASAWFLCGKGLRAARTGAPGDVQSAVATFIFALIAFDTAIAWAANGLWAAAAVAIWALPTLGFRRWFRMS